MTNQQLPQQAIWWKDKKLLLGIFVVFLSIILGLYGKALFIIKFYKPVYLLTGLSIWAFSWILLFFGIFLIGKETVRMIKTRIHNKLEKTVKGTYRYAKELPKRGINKFTKTSRIIVGKIRH